MVGRSSIFHVLKVSCRLASDGTSAGYANSSTATATVTATQPFNRVVIYGAANNDTLTFQFKYVFAPTAVTTNYAAPARLISRSTSILANQNETVVLTGENFASDIDVKFIGTDNVERSPKSTVRDSSTQLTVTRPDLMPPAYNPYTIKVSNPGIALPTTTSQHTMSGAISSGASPVWVTGAQLDTAYYNTSASIQLSATDADGGSTVTYSIISGSLPTGLSMSSAGLISGTSTSTSGGGKALVIRATDSGGNYLDLNTVLPYAMATGGTIEVSGTTLFHTFRSNGTFTPLRSQAFDYYVVGGGGQGSGYAYSQGGGGGGGGGVYAAAGATLNTQAYSVTVGGAGTNSTFNSQTGGAGGGTGGRTGGSSGSPQNYSAGSSSSSSTPTGGAGAGAASLANNGQGGVGYVIPSVQRNGVYSASYQYGAGGDGSGWVSGGGGFSGPGTTTVPRGGPYTGDTIGGSGEANSGGGSGTASSGNPGSGGSGCVIIKY